MPTQEETKPREDNRNDDENYIHAPPESSEDESELDIATKSTPNPPKSSKARPAKARASPLKRSAPTAASQRSKRQKLKDEPSIESLDIPDDPIPTNDLFGFISSGSQKRRLNKTYGRKVQMPPPIEHAIEPQKKGEGLKIPDAIKLRESPVRKSKLVQLDDVSPLRPTRGNRRTRQNLTLPNSPEPARMSKPQKAELRVPDVLDFSSSGGTEIHSFPGVFDSPAMKSRKRSGSDSSLSSVDDMVILSQEREYKTEHEPDRSERFCPVCEKSVHDSAALFVPDNLHTLPFQQQQKFCTQHNIAEATEEWEKRLYPAIRWDEFESHRIPEKLDGLQKVVERKVPSFYLEELDKRYKSANRNRLKIRQYLNEGLIDVVKPGYYGPKGARIMENAITISMKETLNKARVTDMALKEVGLAAYVSAVLVPELTLQIVMDDMKLKTPEEGRKVLDESSAMGELLNPDDDQVEHREEEEV